MVRLESNFAERELINMSYLATKMYILLLYYFGDLLY